MFFFSTSPLGWRPCPKAYSAACAARANQLCGWFMRSAPKSCWNKLPMVFVGDFVVGPKNHWPSKRCVELNDLLAQGNACVCFTVLRSIRQAERSNFANKTRAKQQVLDFNALLMLGIQAPWKRSYLKNGDVSKMSKSYNLFVPFLFLKILQNYYCLRWDKIEASNFIFPQGGHLMIPAILLTFLGCPFLLVPRETHCKRSLSSTNKSTKGTKNHLTHPPQTFGGEWVMSFFAKNQFDFPKRICFSSFSVRECCLFHAYVPLQSWLVSPQ